MLILGKNSDDKGTQLEKLTVRLLESLHYVNCTRSQISAGGAEIDVVAEYVVPDPIRPRRREVICECKAYRSPVSMLDWQKFLGKVFVEEAIRGHEVGGCFIALSGVNGNVKGSFDVIRLKKDYISLVTGDDLETQLSTLLSLPSDEVISHAAARLTDRTIRSLEPAYYDGSAYWVVQFTDGSYTLFDVNVRHMPQRAAVSLHEMLQAEIGATEYLDLNAEALAAQRSNLAQAVVLGVLMRSEGRATDLNPLRSQEFSNEELEAARMSLFGKGMISIHADTGEAAILVRAGEGAPHVPIAVYNQMFHGLDPETLGSRFYDEHVNEAMLNEVLAIQGGVPLGADDRQLALLLLKLSPTAIRRCALPIDMIVTHRHKQPPTPTMDKADRDYLFHLLFNGLRADFEMKELEGYFYNTRHIRELELATDFKLKTDNGVLVDSRTRDRIGIGELSESLGGGLIRIRMLDEAPEPWDRVSPSARTTDESSQEPA